MSLTQLNHEILYKRASHVMPSGVNSPVRSFNGVGGTPLYVESGKGAKITTADSRELVDFCCSWGAMILGHAHPEVVAAIDARARKGTTFGINTPDEVLLAERLCAIVPELEQVRLVNSGTEAVMTAIRLARGVTGRQGIIKFDGCYHGHADSMLVSAGSGLLTGGILSSKGVPESVAADTYVAPYNDLAAVAEIMERYGSEMAAIIVEPIAGNMGLVAPQDDFLSGLRKLTQQYNTLLILDEVITGFRLNFSTYGVIANVQPDLVVLGKVIGGGLPLAAVGGSRVIMQELAPGGGIYQAGTLSGNPLAVSAGLKTLEVLERDNPYPDMAQLGQLLADSINEMAASSNVAMHCARKGGLFTLFFAEPPLENLADVKHCDTKQYAKAFHTILEQGIYLSPSQFELGFISAAHRTEDIMRLIDTVDRFIKQIKQ